jgi:hypothetical protein
MLSIVSAIDKFYRIKKHIRRWYPVARSVRKTFTKGSYKCKAKEALNLLCIYYNDWVIAFSIHSNFILIEALMHKSRISD